ncbi:ribose-phosphate diphosphokinase [Portibacter lacus]|uniref:Ribose-phosphate pyrophosphokinase n=1 Tax=Portibacter lacus TaxID=1099794 RepID=A0AA37WCH2_9BACT|nr:ribose-phosphate diphosphokinase [Portibacter lacus]GLR16033.1 ribose-phosphate pyrophosphokinase [Portibacter lacus]
MKLNLDPNFNPFPGAHTIEFEAFTFHGGEPHIKIKSDLTKVEAVTISHRIQSFNDMGLFLVAVDALRRMGVKNISAYIPYFPAARQDRVMIPGEALSVKVYADLFNAVKLNEITVFDPHSEVTPAVLDHCNAIDNHSFIKEVLTDLSDDVILISPDGGALKKIYKLAAKLQDYDVVECSKSRDVKTGKLSGFQVYHEDLEGRDCLIVDDICDGGGTFMGLAGALKEKNAGKLYLAVSHGIFSKGTEKLNEVFDGIYCTNSFRTIAESEKVKQIAI